MNIKDVLLERIAEQEPQIRDSARVWYVNDSKLWYLTDEQAEGYLSLTQSGDYREGMHDAETNLIERNLESFISYLSHDIRALDLGCGEALKTIKILTNAREKGKDVVFYPVDISKKILDIAVDNATEAGLETYGLQEDFEQFDNLLLKTKPADQTFIYLGANFVNFDSNSILSNIKGSMNPKDVIYFSAQISDEGVDKIIAEYNNEKVEAFLFQTIKHLGFAQEDLEYDARFYPERKEMEMYFKIKNLPAELGQSKLEIGDELIVATSYKPTLKQFSTIAKKYFSGELLFNEARNYVGFIGCPKQKKL